MWAESRGIFEPVGRGTNLRDNRGYGRLIELVKEQQPNVLIFGYGAVEAFDGPGGLEPFRVQYTQLIKDCKAASPEGIRVILLGPMPMAAMQEPLPPRRMRITNRLLFTATPFAIWPRPSERRLCLWRCHPPARMTNCSNSPKTAST